MGFNSTLLVLNDALHLIRDDPEFGKKVYEAVLHLQTTRGRPVDISSGNHCNAATAIESHHADGYRMLLVGGNTAYVLGHAGHWSKDPNKVEDLKTLMNNIAEEYGLKVVKMRRKKQTAVSPNSAEARVF
jgi:hypothetical protein